MTTVLVLELEREGRWLGFLVRYGCGLVMSRFVIGYDLVEVASGWRRVVL